MLRHGTIALCCLLIGISAQAADQTQLGAGNFRAEQIGPASPLVQSAVEQLTDNAQQIQDHRIKQATLDSFLNPYSCIRHRMNVTDAAKTQIINALVAGLLSPSPAWVANGCAELIIPCVPTAGRRDVLRWAGLAGGAYAGWGNFMNPAPFSLPAASSSIESKRFHAIRGIFRETGQSLAVGGN